MANQSSPSLANVLIDGEWRPVTPAGSFTAVNPVTREALPEAYPVSAWSYIDRALDASARAFAELNGMPRTRIADFLNTYAALLDARADDITNAAHRETGLPVEPRLRGVELPRTIGQLRQAARACIDDAWRLPVVDADTNLRSVLEPLGPVLVIGPNNFPFAFNGVAGGDFAAAVAAGCPVIAKAHPSHPTTSRLLAEAAHEAAAALPPGTVQMLFAMNEADGLRMAADHRLRAVAFTGSRQAGLKFKQAADEVGKPVFVELSSVNPVVLLPGALAERMETIVNETVTSGLMGGGQFCTNPGLIVTLGSESTEQFIESLTKHYAQQEPAPLLGTQVLESLERSVQTLRNAGAELLVGGAGAESSGCAFQNTLLRSDAATFLAAPEILQTEAFGNCTYIVVCQAMDEAEQVLGSLEGNLTGCIYSATDGSEDDAYNRLAATLTPRVGRLLNDKMPTGVAVSPAMNHGGPFPSTGHPHFTAVGLPAACRRFTRLMCYDNVRLHRLPEILRG